MKIINNRDTGYWRIFKVIEKRDGKFHPKVALNPSASKPYQGIRLLLLLFCWVLVVNWDVSWRWCCPAWTLSNNHSHPNENIKIAPSRFCHQSLLFPFSCKCNHKSEWVVIMTIISYLLFWYTSVPLDCHKPSALKHCSWSESFSTQLSWLTTSRQTISQ